MTSMRDRLEDVEVPDEAGARERAWASVAGAFAAQAEERPVRRRSGVASGRLRAPIAALGIALVLFAAAVAAGATQPGAAVRSFVVRVLGGDRPPAPRARIGPLPSGKLLVTSQRGTWVVARDGSRRLLGSYTGATWSPHGLYVAAWSGADLSAVAPDGRVAWRLRTPGAGRVGGVVARRLPRRVPAGRRARHRRGRRDGAAHARRRGRPGRPRVAAGRAAHARLGRRGGPRRRARRRHRRAGVAVAGHGGAAARPGVVGRRAAAARPHRRRPAPRRPAGEPRAGRAPAGWRPGGRRRVGAARAAPGGRGAAADERSLARDRGPRRRRDRQPARVRDDRPPRVPRVVAGRPPRARALGGGGRVVCCFRPRPPARRRWRSPRWRSGSAACRSCAAGAALRGSYAASRAPCTASASPSW